MRTAHAQRAFSFIDLLILLAVLWLIAMMITPLVNTGGGGENALLSADANNLKQIMIRYLQQRTDTGEAWAYPAHIGPDNGTAGMTTINGADVSAATAADVTVASFWELARRYELSPDLFNSPAGELRVIETPATDKKINYSDPAATAALTTAWAHGTTDYMLDWSAPKTAGAMRPTLCNRDYQDLFGDKINVIFADAHLGTDSDLNLSSPGVVIYGDKAHTATQSGKEQARAGADDILSNTGDEVVEPPATTGGPARLIMKDLFMGGGNLTRAAMK